MYIKGGALIFFGIKGSVRLFADSSLFALPKRWIPLTMQNFIDWSDWRLNN